MIQDYLDDYYEKIKRGDIDYRHVPDMVEFLKSIEIEDDYDKLDSLEKAHIINTYVARVKMYKRYFTKDQLELWQDTEDQIALSFGRAASDWEFNQQTIRFDPPKFNCSAILAAHKIGMI